MKTVLGLLLFINWLVAESLQEPIRQYISSGAVVDLRVEKNRLYSATNASCVDIFDIETAKRMKQIKVPKIKDFMGDHVSSKVYSVDIMDGTVMLLSQADKGFRRVHIYHNKKLELLISGKDELYIAKARFLNRNTLILGLLSNEMISYDMEKKKIKWRVQVSHSKFSDFVLNENKEEIVVADESGDLKVLDVKDGSLIGMLSGQNLDNVFQVDYKNGVIATAGQDRRVVVYNRATSSAYYKSSSFLIYSVGLSPSGNIVGYASDENNNITLFNTATEEILGHFGGNKMTLSNILFINENEFLVSSDDKAINLFQVK